MEAGVLLPVIEAHCEYRRPARYDDELDIRTTGALLSPVRLQFNYEVTVNGGQEVAAAGWTRHAATDRDGRPRRLPERVGRSFSEGSRHRRRGFCRIAPWLKR
jgi:acyl-CoA thioester hydrolase